MVGFCREDIQIQAVVSLTFIGWLIYLLLLSRAPPATHGRIRVTELGEAGVDARWFHTFGITCSLNKAFVCV